MLFNSLNFLFFFPIVTTLYFLLPNKYRNYLLLAASIYFFMAYIPVYVLILLTTIIISYCTGKIIYRTTGTIRKIWFIIGIFLICGILLFFKYYGFINQNITQLSGAIGWNYGLPSLKLFLPIGISFFTFKSIAYILEVYRGNQAVERNIVIHALYVVFYPALLAGPIDRPQHLIHQFHKEHRFEYENAADGLKLMAWGMFKKIVIADRLAEYVNLVYDTPGQFYGLPVILATYFFAFQIYCDFSGYTDIARGAAKVMGFQLSENFRRPYFAKTVSEFWTRWHITLSSWFRDYIYLPINYSLYNRLSNSGWRKPDMAAYAVAVLTTMSLAGLWHGANWNYVAWGALFGIYMIFSVITKKTRERILKMLKINKHTLAHRAFKILITFHLVLLAWVFFRASDLPAAFTILGSMARIEWNRLGVNLIDSTMLIMSFISISVLIIADLIKRHTSIKGFLGRLPIALRWGLYYSLVMAILLFGKIYQPQQFIYFQF